MTFEVYSAATKQLIVQIQPSHVYIAPAFAKPLERISIRSCFPYYVPEFHQEEKEKIFGNVEVISKENPLYPKALQMYCEAKLLSHPESYVGTKPNN